MGPLADRLFVIGVLGGLIAWVVWGWVAFRRHRPQNLSLGMRSSVAGFCFASASAALGIASGTYAQFREGGFPFNDPTLVRIYFVGFCLAFLGLVFGLCGIGKKTPVRFKAPASLFLLLLWIAQAAGE